ncbi:MAG: family peptidase [Gemmataceae bacterium]|nr:family peptidase [Gemmataceae bacterium]
MRCARPCLFLLMIVVSPYPRLAAAEAGRAITPADYASIATVTELAVSPDGKQVAYTLATWDEKADNRRTDLWVVPTDGKDKPRQLTSDRANDRHPKWSTDGKTLYVLGNRKKDGQKKPPFNGTTQVWKVSAEGGEPEAVTKVDGGVTGYDYAPKADAVFYAADAETTDEDDFSKLRAKYDKLEYGHGKRKVSEVYRLGAREKGEKVIAEKQKVIAEKRYVREFAVTRDGNRVAMITAPDDTVIRSEGDSRVDVWDAGADKVTTSDQSWKTTAGSPWPWLESLAWNSDGTCLAYCTVFDGYPAEVITCEARAGLWPATRMKRPEGIHVRGYGTPLRWADNRTLAWLGESAGSVGLAGTAIDTGELVAGPIPRIVTYEFDLLPSAGLTTVAVEGRPTELPAVVIRAGGGTKLFDPNPHTKSWKLPTVEHVTWKAPDGADVGGPLELPPGYKKGDKKLPLVVALHGGPTTASHAGLEFDAHNGRLYFAAAGYAVLCPNYRGSTGYGDKFVTDLLGRENDVEVKDILAGIRHLVDEGIVDPERIGVMGWSNGGYLTNCLISLKDPPVKIKAASSGAGIVDTVAEWGFNDEPAYPRVFKKGLPWETPDIYRKTSPTYQLGNVRTPTLIHVGGGDERCPPGHSRMLYRALKEYVEIPTQLVVYPGEPHGLTKLSNRKAKMEWDLAWFDRYAMGKK